MSEMPQHNQILFESISKHFIKIYSESNISIVITSVDGQICQVNDAFCQLLKYSRNELLQLNVKDITYVDDQEHTAEFFQEKLFSQQSTVFHIEKRYVRKDKKLVWTRMTATVISDENKKSLYVVAMVEGIRGSKTEQECKQIEIDRMRSLQSIIFKMATHDSVVKGIFYDAIQFINQKTTEALNVERSSIWLFSADRQKLQCIDLYEASKKEHSKGVVLTARDYPNYFKALETGRVIDANDAVTDFRTEEFTGPYLKPLGITSMLDAAIRVSGEIVGVLCCEHIGAKRKWIAAETNFGAEVTDQIGHVILNNERNKVVEKLQESEERFRMMADSAPVMIWVSGEDTFCNFFNKRWLDFVGRNMEQELGKGWIQGVHDEDLELCIEKYLAAFQERKEFQVQYRLKRHDGNFRWVLSNGIPRYTPEGSFQGYIGTCIDITKSKEKHSAERKKAKEELEKSEEYNRMLFELAPMGLALCSLDGKLVDVNQAFANIIGYSIEETLDLTYWDLTPEKYHKEEGGLLEKLKDVGIYGPYEKEYIHKDGYLVPVRLSGMILERGGEKYIWSAVQNIAEARKYKDTIESSQVLLQSQKESLEQKNVALREILEQIEIEKKQIKEDVVSNVEALLMPALRKLKRKGSRLDIQNINILENNIKELTAPFGSKVSDKKWKLTPREIEICNLIKNGLSSKEISTLLNVAFRTVEIHRNNIRKKLEINNKKINLSSYLQSFH